MYDSPEEEDKCSTCLTCCTRCLKNAHRCANIPVLLVKIALALFLASVILAMVLAAAYHDHPYFIDLKKKAGEKLLEFLAPPTPVPTEYR